MRRWHAVGFALALLVMAPGAAAVQAAPGTHAAADASRGTTDDLRVAGTEAILAGGGTTEGAADGGPTDGAAAAEADDDACEAVAGGEQRPNPDEDQLGWENGCWSNDPINVTRTDGLNETELDAVVARSMARVEVIRELEFQATVPVEVISRAQFRTESSNRTYNESDRLHQNVKWEAMLMVNESTDAIAVRQSNTGATVGGYYSPSEQRIVIVSENTTSPKMNEITLSQELFHALQDQHFNLSAYNQSTEELHNAKDGIIEGDGNYVDHLYSQRCDTEWECLMPEPSGGSGGGGDIHVGQYIVTFTPYSEGPEFVRGLHQEGGWEAVNAVYENPPASTEQIIHPDKYGEDEPTQVRFEDTSSDGWRVLDLEGGIDYAQYGEAGIFSMFWYASYEESVAQQAPATVVIPYTDFFQYQDGPGSDLQEIGPYSYAHEASDGWDGDKLVPYVTDDSAETNETGYVWKMEWDTEQDAREFVEAYQKLLEYRGAEPVEGRQSTFRIPDDQEFGDAFHVEQDGSTVVIVNAPTVEDLGSVRAGAAPEPTAMSDATETSTTDGTDSTPGPTEASTPGFGLLAGVLALLAGALLVHRR